MFQQENPWEHFVRVLIAIDAMSPRRESVRAAVERPWPAGSAFCLLHVFRPYPFTAAPIIQEGLKERVISKLEVAAKSVREAGWDTSVELSPGSPRREINRFAKVWGADLVMIDCNDLSDLGRLLLGSTAQSVVRHAPCSVEVVRPKCGPEDSACSHGMRILVATDGSEFALAALRSVASRPWPVGSVARVISVPEFILLKESSYLKTHQVTDLGEAALDDARLSIAAGVGALSASSLKLSSGVPKLEDRPYRVILHEAETWLADLIVLGSHGRSGFDRVIMGSVSEVVALHARCSVEVIRDVNAYKT